VVLSRGIFYDDIDNTGRNTPLEPEKLSYAPHQLDRVSYFSSTYGSLTWEIRNLPRRSRWREDPNGRR